MTMTATQRKMRAQIAANTRWARCDNRSKATSKARAAFMDKFERQVDPAGVLVPEERAKRAENLRKAHYMKMSIRSAEARKR